MMRKLRAFLLLILASNLSVGCSTVKSALGVSSNSDQQPSIHNPFDQYSPQQSNNENIILRTKKGDRSVEVELPGGKADMTDFVLPMSPSFKEPGRTPASSGETGIDDRFKDRQPSITDREITHRLSEVPVEDEAKRREIEGGLGVSAAEESTPQADKSYLAAIDQVKQLYRISRYEAALLELDEMLRLYPTDPRLYEMRGTLLDRIGKPDLALKSWNQALRLEPSNPSLKKFVEHKQHKRSVASP